MLLTIAKKKTNKQAIQVSIDDWISKMNYYSDTDKNKVLKHAIIWINSEHGLCQVKEVRH